MKILISNQFLYIYIMGILKKLHFVQAWFSYSLYIIKKQPKSTIEFIMIYILRRMIVNGCI